MVTSTKRTRAWRHAHPERWKELQKNYRDRNKKPPKIKKDSKIQDRIRRQELKKRIHIHKTDLGCSKCKYNKYGGALDWHHTDDNKERRITIRSYFSKLGELEREKCILLCANCHREEHEDQKIKENGDVYPPFNEGK